MDHRRWPRLVVASVVCAMVAACAGAEAPDQEAEMPVSRTVAYGDHPAQVLDLDVPAGAGPFPVVVFVHGGFWSAAYGRDLMVPLATDAVGRGWATANLEFRRVGGDGGWPATFGDVATAMDALADLEAPIDLDRVAVVGHSSGGHLAAWIASRDNLPEGAPGGSPRVRPCATVSQAGVVDLQQASADRVGGGAVSALLGGSPAEVPDRYAAGDPTRLAPPPAPVLLVHADGDRIVPVDQSRSYARAAGTAATLEVVSGDHFSVIDPSDPSWETTMTWLSDRCGVVAAR